MNTIENKYEERVFEQYPHMREEIYRGGGSKNTITSKWEKQLFDNLVTQEKWYDAIENKDVNFLNQLLKESKTRYQKWLSNEVMDTITFKCYSLMYRWKCYWYFWAETERTKNLDKEIEQSLRNKGYSEEEVAGIFMSKRYKQCLEEHLSNGIKEEIKSQVIGLSMLKVDEFIEDKNNVNKADIIDEYLIELSHERGLINESKKDLVFTKGGFLKERLSS